MADFKTFFLNKFEPEIQKGSIRSILDMGSGLSLNFIPLLEKYPDLTYVGLEPSFEASKKAKLMLSKFPKARIYNATGYEPVGDMWGKFDLVISLSVLEHVKQLERFLENSIEAARPGGQIVHRWDLGHSLYPSSLKERFQVWLGDNAPVVLPENKFVRTLLPSEFQTLLEGAPVSVEKTTYHQMPCHKVFLKLIEQSNVSDPALIEEIAEWEFEASSLAPHIDEKKYIKLFPAVAVWLRR